MERKKEISKAMIRVKIKGLKIFSGKPPTNINGKTMAMVAMVPEKTGPITSLVPLMMAVSSSSFKSLRCRSIFSSTTTALSVSIPSAKIIAV